MQHVFPITVWGSLELLYGVAKPSEATPGSG